MYSTIKKLGNRWLVLLLISTAMPAYALIDSSKKLLFDSARNALEEQLTHLKNDFLSWQTANQEQLKKIQAQLEVITRSLIDAKNQNKDAQGKDAEYWNKIISLLNEINQSLLNNQLLRREITADLTQHIKLLEEYRKNPTFKDLILEPQAVYTLEQLRNLIQKILYGEGGVEQLTVQKSEALIELDNRKKKLNIAVKEYQEKKLAQQDFDAKNVTLFRDFDFQQRGQLLDLTEKLANYEKQVAELKVQEMVRRISLLNTKIFIEGEKVKVLKENLTGVKNGLRVSDAELDAAREKLEKNKTESLTTKDKIYAEIKALTVEREKLKRELEIINRRYANADRNISAWSVANKTPENYSALAEIGSKTAQIALQDRKIEYLHAEIDLADAIFKRQEINFLILSMWHTITQRRVKVSDEVARYIKRFRDVQSDAQRELTLVTDKRAAATNLLNLQNKETANLKNFVQEIKTEQDSLFKRYPSRFTAVINKLTEAEKALTEQIESTSKLIEVDSNLIATLDEMVKELNFVLSDLEAKSIWQRSEYAITWDGIKNIFPDTRIFFKDVGQLGGQFFSALRVGALLSGLIYLLTHPFTLLMWLILIAVLIGVYIFLFRLIKWLRVRLFSVSPLHKIVLLSARIMAVILLCIERHYISLFIWSVLFSAVAYEFIPDLFLRVVFYLLSIPYFLYIAHDCAPLIIGANRTQHFRLFGKAYERRFELVFYLFAYGSIIMLLLREAFIAATIHKSELPTILLASYSLFLRIIIIFSIGREEVVSFISRQGTFGHWISKYISTYYYVLLALIVGLMVVSDPYVGGYGNLISYILWGLIASVLLVKLLMLANGYIKRWVAALFFASDEEALQERFAYAKTLYGLVVIVIFIFMVITATLLATRIWMVPVTWTDVNQVLNFQLFDTGVDKTTGQLIWFTPLKFVMVLCFIAVGLIVSILINRFVLRFIFDLLPVDSGVQNTIMSIMRYLIIFIAIYLGFQWGGLGTLLLAIGVVIGSIAYIVKEPFADFISYFIILVQRPIQVGDYILIDPEHDGIVRKITPRSIILRRRDSYTIIVPNSMILNRPINNWNYARNFVGIDDIEFTIPYEVDPVLVRKLILAVLDENPDILKSPRPVIRLNDFAENGFLFKVRGFVSEVNVGRKWDIASDIRFGLIQAFRNHAIKIALPTRVIINKDKAEN